MASLQSETETMDNEFRVKSLKDIKGILVNNIQLQESYMKMVNLRDELKELKAFKIERSLSKTCERNEALELELNVAKVKINKHRGRRNIQPMG